MLTTKVGAERCNEIENHLFKVGLTVLALSQSEELKATAKGKEMFT